MSSFSHNIKETRESSDNMRHNLEVFLFLDIIKRYKRQLEPIVHKYKSYVQRYVRWNTLYEE